ncbi:MAG TPA: hypothetical protein VND93_11605, partial [Myxococcales bacterium]|nr:hypothetical protein [Myxococcales bacterium]
MSTTSVSGRPTASPTVQPSQPTQAPQNAAAPALKSDAFDAQAPQAAAPTAPQSTARSLTSQVKDKLVSFLWDELGKEHSVELAKLNLGPNGALGIRASEKILKPGDDAVAKDPQRSAYEQSPEASSPHVWLQTGGVIDANLGLSVPVNAGGATGSIGFNAGSSLQFSLMSPYGASADGAVDLAARHTIDLPVTAQNARALPRGSEMMLKGQGQVGASGSIGAGTSWTEGPVTVGVSGRVNGSVSASGEITVNVKKLDGDRVYVRLGEAGATRESAGASVDAGVSVDHQQLDDLVNGGLDTILSGEVRDFVEKTADKQIDSQVDKLLRKYASAGAQVLKAASQQSAQLDAYVVDLSTPEGRAAYDGLMKLDRGPAERLVAAGDGSVAHYQEHKTTDSFNASAHVGPATLFDFSSSRTDRDGKLHSSGGDATVQQSTYDRSFEWLFAGKKHVTWEGVRSEVDGAPKTYLHVAYDRRIKSTDQGDLAKVDRAMKALGVPAARLDAHPDKDGDVGDTKTTLDAYVAPSAVAALARVPRSEVEAAYARAVQKVDGLERVPAWGDPATAAAARQLIKDYTHARLGNTDERGRESQLSAEYSRRYGRW